MTNFLGIEKGCAIIKLTPPWSESIEGDEDDDEEYRLSIIVLLTYWSSYFDGSENGALCVIELISWGF